MGSESLLGAFEEMVLLAVARGGGDAYGMTVRREIEERTGRDITIGAAYATLERLEKKGLLGSTLGSGSPERRGRARRYFQLQPSGAEALGRAREMRAGMWEGVAVEDLIAEAEGGR